MLIFYIFGSKTEKIMTSIQKQAECVFLFFRKKIAQ